LAVGSGNDTIYILFTPDWKLLSEFGHIPLTRFQNADHYEEESPGRFVPSKFPVQHFDARVSGISRIQWSNSGKYIASQSCSYNRTIFIWEIESLSLTHVFTFLTAITDAQWSPTDDNLAIAFGTDKILNWKPNGFRVSHVEEAAIQMHFLKWRADGESLAAYDSAAGTCTLAFVLGDDE
jgi:WD40 repeat protein